MQTAQFRAREVQIPVEQLKESIRDLVRMQRTYQLSDELFWEIFNIRVLLDKPIDIDEFIADSYLSSAYA